MIWVIKFIAGFFIFVIFGAEVDSSLIEIGWINGIIEFFLGIGLALALFLVYKDKEQDYKHTAWRAGITWYVILLVMDMLVLVGLFSIKLDLWFPLIITYFTVLVIPIVVGYLLDRNIIKSSLNKNSNPKKIK